tara:strand:- start:354 stop:1364 length:1011 start_codon:yes stop_codon:yes gene_type:complete
MAGNVSNDSTNLEINNFSYYKSNDFCYTSKNNIDESNFITNYFTKHVFLLNSTNKNIKNCKDEAIKSNADYFLISDAKFTQDNSNISYSCLIPKQNKGFSLDSNNNYQKISNLLQPFSDVFNALFDDTGKTNITREYSDLNNIMSNLNTDVSKCFSVNLENKKYNFATAGKYALYKTELFDNQDLLNQLSNITSYKKHEEDFNQFNNNVFDNLFTELSTSFLEYIKNPTSQQTNMNFNNKMTNLVNTYNSLYTYMETLAGDISSVTVLTNYNTLYLYKLQENIDKEKYYFNNLLKTDAGNNGKLHDTRYMKNIKISEISLLLFITAIVIFLYSKNK